MSDLEERANLLLHQATESLDPDVDRLVRNGRERGRRRRRRTNWLTGASIGALVTAAVVVPLAIDRGDDVSTLDVTTTPAPATGHRRALAVAPADIPKTFASIFPGRITAVPQKESDVPVVDFGWDDVRIRVSLGKAEYHVAIPTDPTTGRPEPVSWTRAGSPMTRCNRDNPDPGSCRLRPDGSAVRTLTGDLTSRGGETISDAYVFTADGWDIIVGCIGHTSPLPLSVARLLSAAESTVWFR